MNIVSSPCGLGVVRVAVGVGTNWCESTTVRPEAGIERFCSRTRPGRGG